MYDENRPPLIEEDTSPVVQFVEETLVINNHLIQEGTPFIVENE